MERRHRRYKVVVEVERIRGECPRFQDGDRIVYVEPAILLDETSIATRQLCPFALMNIFPYVVALGRGITAMELGLATNGDDGFVACQAPDRGETPKAHGQVVFAMRRIPIDRSLVDRSRADRLARGLPG